MSKTKIRAKTIEKGRGRVKKSDRRQQILLELKLRPHVRINELAQRFNVSNETVRREFDALSNDGLIARAHDLADLTVGRLAQRRQVERVRDLVHQLARHGTDGGVLLVQ